MDMDMKRQYVEKENTAHGVEIIDKITDELGTRYLVRLFIIDFGKEIFWYCPCDPTTLRKEVLNSAYTPLITGTSLRLVSSP